MSSPARDGSVSIHADLAALTLAAAEWFVRGAAAAVAERGRCTVAISGGATPMPLYALLATPDWRNRVPWPLLHLFWCDERVVPADDERSNYGGVRRVLLPQVDIPAGNVHQIPTSTATPAQAAALYEQTIRRVVGGGALPALDLVLLGIGDDGHTASLFPGSSLLRIDRSPLVAADPVPRAGTFRVSMTLPLLNAAREVAFLVAGDAKANALRDTLGRGPAPHRLPAQLVRPTTGSLRWLVDRAAAAHLSGVPLQ